MCVEAERKQSDKQSRLIAKPCYQRKWVSNKNREEWTWKRRRPNTIDLQAIQTQLKEKHVQTLEDR